MAGHNLIRATRKGYERGGPDAVIQLLGRRQIEVLRVFAEPSSFKPSRVGMDKWRRGELEVALCLRPWPQMQSLCARGLMWAQVRQLYDWEIHDWGGSWSVHGSGVQFWAGLTPLGQTILKALPAALPVEDAA